MHTFELAHGLPCRTGSSTSHHMFGRSGSSNVETSQVRMDGPFSPKLREHLRLIKDYLQFQGQPPVRSQTARRRLRVRTDADASVSSTSGFTDDHLRRDPGTLGCVLSLHRLTDKLRLSFSYSGSDKGTTFRLFGPFSIKVPKRPKSTLERQHLV